MQNIIKRFQANSVIFKQGDLGTEMFVVASGEVEIFTLKNDTHKTIATLKQGEMFGEMALVASDRSRSTYAKATQDDTVLVCINESRFVYLVSQQPAFALSVIRTIAQRLSKLNDLPELVRKIPE